MTGRSLFRTAKPLLLVIGVLFRVFPRVVFVGTWFLVRSMPGKVGVLIRYLYARRLAKACGDNVLIGPACTILHWKNLELGNNVALHERSYVDAIGGVSVGNDVSIAHATSILSFEHTWTNRAKPIKYNDLSLSPIAIASDTWIGCGVRILAGACIGERTVIAAGAVVPKGCYKAGVFAGVPARLKKAIS